MINGDEKTWTDWSNEIRGEEVDRKPWVREPPVFFKVSGFIQVQVLKWTPAWLGQSIPIIFVCFLFL